MNHDSGLRRRAMVALAACAMAVILSPAEAKAADAPPSDPRIQQHRTTESAGAWMDAVSPHQANVES